MVHGLGTDAIIGIAVGSVIAGVVIIIFLTHFLRMWLRGPSLGSDCRKRLDGKVVAITGKQYFDLTSIFMTLKGCRNFPFTHWVTMSILVQKLHCHSKAVDLNYSVFRVFRGFEFSR